ncbi:MAG: hypothetical protein O8C61_04200 [Candidatus Methanoperedens sp.]|nr:hypothetical protein [Candidatus Methanoperedens sp.]
MLTPRRASIGLISSAPQSLDFPARNSGRDPGAAMGTWGARRPWNFTKAASGQIRAPRKLY